MRQWLICVALVITSTLMVSMPAQSRSLIRDVEKGLKGVRRDLCAIAPSSKCKTTKKTKPAVKKPDVVAPTPTPAPVPKKPAAVTPAPTPPPKPIPAPPPPKAAAPAPTPPKPAVVAPTPAVPLPKPMPPDLKVPPPVPLPPQKPANLNVPPLAATPAPTPKVPIIVPKPVPAVPPVAATPAQPSTGNCLADLAASGAQFSPVPQPVATGDCTIDNPVKMTNLKTLQGLVKLPDQPTVNCKFALTLQNFVAGKVQPLAQSDMQSTIVAMGTGPGFDCRGRNGDSSAKLSEHAKGNAVDIVFFNFANKTGVLVKDALNDQATGFAFLRDVRAEACKAFTTVLGPGANSAHAEHFHLDLEPRNGGYRICQ